MYLFTAGCFAITTHLRTTGDIDLEISRRIQRRRALVVGAGSSGTLIADELSRAGRRVYLCVGQHERPPRRYRGKDFCFWLDVLGLWDAETRDPAKEHVTIAVSGAHGGHTIDFRHLAARGITLLGRADAFADGVMRFAPGLARDLAAGDANYLSLLDAADAYAAREGLDVPEEPAARVMEPEPSCVTAPILRLGLRDAGITTIIWATGFAFDFGWLQVGALARLRGLDGFSGVRSLSINELAGKVFTTVASLASSAIANSLVSQSTARGQAPLAQS